MVKIYDSGGVPMIDNSIVQYGNDGTGYIISGTNYLATPEVILSVTSGETGALSSSPPAFNVYGRDILAELDELRDALLLLKRHVDMEAKYPRLKELKDEYEQTLEKYKTFEALK